MEYVYTVGLEPDRVRQGRCWGRARRCQSAVHLRVISGGKGRELSGK